ncbi:MAG: hypothetical protein ACYC2H_00315 [Thermoplasmatota archaeon]
MDVRSRFALNGLTATALLVLLALSLVPGGQAQSPVRPLGAGDAAVSAPHGVELVTGENDVMVGLAAIVRCDPALAGPDPLTVVLLAGAQGPGDGSGVAWIFTDTSWTFNWTTTGDGNYSIREEFAMPAVAHGYGTTGYAGEFSVGIGALRNASSSVCSPTGYTMPARTGHAHIQVGPRPPPATTDRDAPALELGLGLTALALLAMRRR